jgi:hypothetical protein
MNVPNPTPIYRFMHVDNLALCLRWKGMYAPNHAPTDGVEYKTIHNSEIQGQRHVKSIPCGPCGTVHDYVSFYFGYLSPMMLQLHTGRVDGYGEDQRPLIYLVSSAQSVKAANLRFVFSDGHGIARFTRWFDDLNDLSKVDWGMVNERYWPDRVDDMDRQRRKQAEFLIYRFCPWTMVQEIGVIDAAMHTNVEDILNLHNLAHQPVVRTRRDWYYY